MASFLQSPEWQEIQERMGRPTARVSGALVIRHCLPFGLSYLYAPRPPAPGPDFFPAARSLAVSAGAMFLKIDPAVAVPPGTYPGAVPTPPLQARQTVVIDARRPEQDLLAAMHPKTRYNIRVAERHGVMARPVGSEELPAALERFSALLAATARRGGFSPHPPEHYRILTAVESNTFSNNLWVAERAGELLAAAITNWYSPARTATYLHGVSAYAHRALMAPHLLHWYILQAARMRGFWYDLGGIDQARWPGLTRFKQGFGGTVLDSGPSWELPYRPWLHYLYRLRRRIRRGPTNYESP